MTLRWAIYGVAVIGSICTTSAFASRWAKTDVLDRALAASVCAISLAAGVPLLLSMSNVLSRVPYLVVLLTLGTVSAILLLRDAASPPRAPAAWSFAGLLALGTGTAIAVIALLPTVRGQLAGHPDTKKYHIVNLVQLTRSHSLWHLAFQNPGFMTATHPGNGELATVGLMFATGGDHLIYDLNVVFAAVVVIACTSIARDLDGRPHQGALAAMAVMASPLVFSTQAHGLASDLPAAAGLVAGVAALLRARREHDTRWIAIAGLALGFAFGAKYTVLFIVPVVVLAALLTIRPVRDASWLAPGFVLLAAPWFVRNWVTTGNPLFPQRIGLGSFELFAGGVTPLDSLRSPIAAHALAGRTEVLARWGDLLWGTIGPAVILAFAGVIGVTFQRPRRRDRSAIAGLAVVAAVAYAVTPFTGGGLSAPAFLIGSNLRYLMPALFVGVSLAAVAVPARLLTAVIGATFAYDAWKMLDGYGFRHDLDLGTVRVVLASVAVIAVCAAIVLVGRRRFRPGIAVYATAAVVAVVGLAGALREIDDRRPSPELERVITQLRARRVAVLGGPDLRSVLGPRLDVTIVAVTGGRSGERVPATIAELDRRVLTVRANVLVVRTATPGVPQNWTPPGWVHRADTPGGAVYVRRPAVA